MKFSGLILILAATACAGDVMPEPEPEYPVGFNPPPPPEIGVQLLGVPFEVQPGEEVFQCVYLPERLAQDLDIVEMVAYQMVGGHHILFSWVDDDFEPNETPHECDESEMVNHRLIGVGGTEQAVPTPEGVAYKAPGGKRLVIQSHYVNASDNPITVMDAINLIGTDKPITDYASQMVLIDLTFELPAMERVNRSIECEITEESKVFTLTGHTHEWGERFTLELTRAGETEAVSVFDVDVDEGFRDEPPMLNFEPADPLVLHPGDKLRMECQWFNDTAASIFYPKEMCAAPLFYYPSRGFEICAQDGGLFEAIEL